MKAAESSGKQKSEGKQSLRVYFDYSVYTQRSLRISDVSHRWTDESLVEAFQLFLLISDICSNPILKITASVQNGIHPESSMTKIERHGCKAPRTNA